MTPDKAVQEYLALDEIALHNAQRKYLQNDEAAQRYAESDRTDPFALARARTHIKQGQLAFDEDGRCLYDAGKRP